MTPGSYIGSGGAQMVNLDSLIHSLYGYTRNVARKLIDHGEVKIDGKQTYRVAIEVEAVAGHEITVRGETQEVPA